MIYFPLILMNRKDQYIIFRNSPIKTVIPQAPGYAKGLNIWSPKSTINLNGSLTTFQLFHLKYLPI